MNTASLIDSNKTTLGKPINVIRNQTLARKLENAKILGTIPIKVRRYFTDVDGVVIAKGAAPASLQVDYPVYVLGEFDRQGGYKIGQLSRPPMRGTYFLFAYVKGKYVDPIIDFSGSNTVNNYISPGDVVQVYTNNLSAPSYFVYIVQSIQYAGLASVLSDTRNGDIEVDSFSFYSDNNDEQFAKQLILTRGKVIGTYIDDQINPLLFKTPANYQNGFIDILVAFNMSQYLGINFYMAFATDAISMNFKIKHL